MMPTKGYKQTEVGCFPEDWDVVRSSELLAFRNGANADKGAYGAGTPFINVLEVITHSHLHTSNIPGRVTLPESVIGLFAVRRGDIMFNRTSETQDEVGLASVYLDDDAVIFGGFVIRGRPTGERIDEIYSGYGLRAPAIRAQIIARGQGAIRANIGQADLGQVLVPLPPLPEQRAIATALADVDALVSGLDQLITKKRDMKHAATQQLLTEERRLPGFRGGWPTKKLGNFSRMRTGPFGSALHKSDYTRDGIPILNPMHIVGGNLIPTSTMTITPRAAKQLSEYLLRAGDIIMGRRGDMGRCAVVTEHQAGWLCGTGSLIIRPNAETCPAFLQRVLSSRQVIARIENSSVGTTMVNLNQGVLRGLDIQLPPLPEQRAIAAVLSDMDAELAALERRRDKTLALKQGMMQELLTGRTRLV